MACLCYKDTRTSRRTKEGDSAAQSKRSIAALMKTQGPTLSVQHLDPDHLNLQPLLDEVALLFRGNDFERQNQMLQLRDLMRRNQGLVLKQGDRVLALLLYYLKAKTCRLSFAYALADYHPEVVLRHLFQTLISLVIEDREINSIRCDVVPWFPQSVASALSGLGFTRVERMVMRRDLPCPERAPAFTPGIKLVPWDTWLTAPAAQILHLAFGMGFEGSWDRSLAEIAGCRQFISDCYSGRFGTFDAAISFALMQENQWVGMALATWAGEGDGFIPAFGLLPQFCGKGIGQTMLAQLLKRFGQATYPPGGVELAVSVDNTAAVRLYQKFDFRRRSSFEVYFLNISPET